HAIATINQLAPGRTILGFGTGHTGRRVMGLDPVKQTDFCEQVRELRDLLTRGETDYRTEGVTRHIRYLHRDRRFINLDDRIPLYVAANGPKTLALAGEFGDGIITTGVATVERVEAVRRYAEVGAAKVGRSARELPLVSLTHLCVLRPGEPLDSPRVKAICGHWVMASFHAIAAGYARTNSLPAEVRSIYDAYAAYVANLPNPPAERYLDVHVGHCTFVAPAEQRFVTAESIRATTMVGPREELIDRLRALERAGLGQMFLNPPMDGYAEYIEEIERELVGRV
ncbi:MAG TPA: LLM class flavin-dependent oxidoreductase, partial [Candidatus Binataceae bacterium]|nr:LLM class flavin-dependent oxidoreductase [Candidatus Binataceae bacterium]